MRLIDADRLLMHLSDYALQEAPWWGANGYGNKDAYEAIEESIKAVEEAPTVEAVEVVRCKDCAIRFDSCPMVVRFGRLIQIFTEDEDFCSRGRREDEGKGV